MERETKLILSCWRATIDDINKHLATGIVRVVGYHKETEEIKFECNDGTAIYFFHDQDCCEYVRLVDADGLDNNVDIFTGCKWCKVEEVKKESGWDNYGESYTWTFYKFTTDKGYDTMRWLGESNGYYSEEVNFEIWSIEVE